MKDISNVDLDSPGILDVKWLQQNSASTGNKHGRKRGIDALLDFSGTSTLVAVLESSEVSVAFPLLGAPVPLDHLFTVLAGRLYNRSCSSIYRTKLYSLKYS